MRPAPRHRIRLPTPADGGVRHYDLCLDLCGALVTAGQPFGWCPFSTIRSRVAAGTRYPASRSVPSHSPNLCWVFMSRPLRVQAPHVVLGESRASAFRPRTRALWSALEGLVRSVTVVTLSPSRYRVELCSSAPSRRGDPAIAGTPAPRALEFSALRGRPGRTPAVVLPTTVVT